MVITTHLEVGWRAVEQLALFLEAFQLLPLWGDFSPYVTMGEDPVTGCQIE